MVRRSKSWYTDKLSTYFKEHYLCHLNVIPQLVTPAPNKWAFDIPPLRTRVILICDDSGHVTEELGAMRNGSIALRGR